MTNFEKYAEKIRETISIEREPFDCIVSELRGASDSKYDREDCAECALKNIDWLQQEYSENCTDCKWYRKIEGESKYYACFKEGQVLSAGDEDVDCGFWEEK